MSDIIHILKHPAINNIPTVLKGDTIQNVFKQVATLLGNDKSQPLPNYNKTNHRPTLTNCTHKSPTNIKRSERG